MPVAHRVTTFFGVSDVVPPSAEPYRGGPSGPPLPELPRAPRRVYLVLATASTAAFVAACALWLAAALGAREAGADERLVLAGAALFGVTVAAFFAQVLAGAYWMFRAWSWLPPEQRWAETWSGWITPGQAGFFLLLPYFHYYWMFVVSMGLCDALERMRVAHPTPRSPPKPLAIAASVCQLLAPVPVGSVLWLLFMTKVERLARAMRPTPS